MPPAQSAAAKSFSSLEPVKDTECDRAAKPSPGYTLISGERRRLVIPSAVEESLNFSREIVRDVSTFARHDKSKGQAADRFILTSFEYFVGMFCLE